MRSTRITPYIGDRTFYRTALLVMLPVVLQQLTTAAFSFMDSTMLARIDELSMSAVAVAGKMNVINNSIFFGFAGAASILLSQYHGAGRMDICQRIFSLQLVLGLLYSLAFATLIFLFPGLIMRVFVQDPYTISVGISYLRIMAWSYVPASFSLVCLFSLRAMGINFLPMLVSLLGIVVNLFWEWALIFGKLGMPRMGVQGAALGSLLTRTLEMSTYALLLFAQKTPFRLTLTPAFRIGKPLMRDYLHKAFPLTANELLWTAGLLVYFWAYARVNESALSALNVSEQVINLAMVLNMGMGSAVAVMVGRQLGANRFELAKKNAKLLFGLTIIISTISAAIALVLSFAVGAIFPTLPPQNIAITRLLIFLLIFLIHGNSLYSLCFLLLRAGGDTKNTVLLDSGFMWILPAPVALLIGIFLPGKIAFIAAAGIVQCLNTARFIPALRVVQRGTWLKNLTRDHA